jgi:6-phosphogluconolactonase (cycloisomerase 2 family)
MKKTAILLGLIFVVGSLFAQTISPKVFFQEQPRTHNVHLTTDGEYLYTCNGGKAHEGMINKFSMTGELIETYDIYLDLRSIMYNSKDKSFYVASFDRNIYKITSLESGSFELVHEKIYDNEQANLAIGTKGKYLYYMSEGTVIVYTFSTGVEKKRFTSIDCGPSFTEGSCAIAVGEKHFYTWNAKYKLVFVYDMKGNKVKDISLSNGNYGFSLSYANGMVFVSVDGDYETGTWYGYDVE